MTSCGGDPIFDPFCSYVTYVKNTTNESVLCRTYYYSQNATDSTDLTLFSDSLMLICPGEIEMVMDFVPAVYLDIFSVEDTSLISREEFCDDVNNMHLKYTTTPDTLLGTEFTYNYKSNRLCVQNDRYLYENIDKDHYFPVTDFDGRCGAKNGLLYHTGSVFKFGEEVSFNYFTYNNGYAEILYFELLDL